jgi:hypothetical protein
MKVNMKQIPPITDNTSRLVIADWCEDNDLGHLAAPLRDLRAPLILRGTSLHYHPIAISPAENQIVKAVKVAIASRKRNVYLRIAIGVVKLYGRFWDEGSITYWTRMYLEALSPGHTFTFPNTAPWSEAQDCELHPGEILVSHGYCQGKPVIPTIHIHPEDAHRFGLTYIPVFEE